MDKLKKILSPGSSKDDEVLYGDAESRRQASVANTGNASGQDTTPLRTVDESQKSESGGVLRQILNPGGEKHDEHAYGTNATTEPVDPKLMQTHPEHKKDHTVLGQLLNPGGDKYDEQRFGTTGQTGGDLRRESVRPEVGQDAIVSPEAKLATDDSKKDHSILRQIINPGGDNYDSVAYGRNASVVSGQEHERLQNDPARQEDRGSISRQIFNSNQEKYDPVMHGAGPSGSSVTGAGSSQAAGQTLPGQTAQTGEESHLGRDAAVAGGLTAAGAGTYAATHRENESKEYNQPSSTTTTHPSTTTTTTTTTSTNPQSTYQPTSQQPQTDNSQFGRDGKPEVYTDPSNVVQNTQTTQPQSATQQSTYQNTPQQSDSSHLGRDAAILGGVGAAGAGAYAAHQHGDRSGQDTTDSKMADRAHPLAGSSPSNYVNPIGAPESSLQSSTQRPDESHFGRDATVAGGVGYDSSSSTKITERPHPLHNRGDNGHINPISAPEAPETQVDSHLHGSSNPVSGHTYNSTGAAMGTGPIDIGSASTGSQQTGIGEGATQLNQAPEDVQNATYTERAVPLGAGYHHTAGPHSTDTANRLDPHVPGEFPTEEGDDPHGLNPAPLYQSTRSAPGAATGTGLAGAEAGAAAYGLSGSNASQQMPQQSAAATSHPGGQSYPVQGTTGVAGSSVPAQTESTSEHHYGRDAALTGGAGAATIAAYEATKRHDGTGSDVTTQTRGPQPTSEYGAPGFPAQTTSTAGDNVSSQARGPQATSEYSGQSYPVSTTTGTETGAPYSTQGMQPSSEHHYGRDAALVGGTSAVGLGAYEASQGRGDTGPASKTIGPHESNVANVMDPRVQAEPSQMKSSTTAGPHQSDMANRADPRVDSDQSKQDNHGRDAAMLAGGAAAGAAAGYGASNLIDEKEQRKLDKQHEKEVKQHEKEVAKEQKAQQKEAEKAQKQHDKEVAKEEKKAQKQHDKEVAKQEKQHEKEVAKQEKQHEKEVAKAERQHEKEQAKAEKQHEKEVAKAEREAEHDREKREKEMAAAGGVGAAGVGAYEAEKHHDASQQQGRQSYDTEETGHSSEKKRGLIDRILHPTRKSEDDDRVAADEDGRNKLHKKHAPKAYEGQHEASPLGQSSTTGGEYPSTAAHTSNQGGLVAGPSYEQQGTVTEPHTGLPMNVGQYGSGAGGTDGAQQIEGYHQHPAGGVGESATGPDWNAIKKENTPY